MCIPFSIHSRFVVKESSTLLKINSINLLIYNCLSSLFNRSNIFLSFVVYRSVNLFWESVRPLFSLLEYLSWSGFPLILSLLLYSLLFLTENW